VAQPASNTPDGAAPGETREIVVLHFKATVERVRPGRFKAAAGEFPGVVSYGESAEEAQAALEAAILKHLAATSTVALEGVHEEKLGMIPYAGLVHDDRLYLGTNLDVMLVTETGKKDGWKRVPVTQQATDFYQVFEGGAEDIFEPGEYTTQIYALASFALEQGAPAVYAGTNLKGLVYVNEIGDEWRPAFSTGEERVHSLAGFGGHLYAGTSSKGRIFRWDGRKAEVVNQSREMGVTALAVHGGALYAGTYPEGLILRSEDGELWEIVCRTRQKMVNQFCSYRDGLYAGCSNPSGGSVFRTADGMAWERCFASERDPNVYNLASFGGRLYAGTGENGRLYATRDGAHWEPVAQSPEAAMRVVVAHRGRLFVACERRGVVYRSAGTEAPNPVISGVEVHSLASSRAVIEWSTDVACDATVQYGAGSVRDRTASNPSMAIRHRIALEGLKAGTKHSFMIASRSADDGQAVELREEGFTTPVLPAPALVSETHPEDDRWYPRRDVRVSWPEIPGATGYAYGFSSKRNAVLAANDPRTRGTEVALTADADGAWFLAVAGIDSAGNVGEVALRALRCDTAAGVPVVTSVSHPSPDSWYHSSMVEMKAEGLDDDSGVEGYLFAIGRVGEAWESLSFQAAPGPVWTLPRLPDGAWEVFVRLRDAAGNEGTPASLRVQVDTSPPTVVLDPVPALIAAGELELKWSARDDRSGIAKVAVQQRRETVSGPADWETVYEGKTNAVKVVGRDGERIWYRVVASDRAGLQAAAETHQAVLYDGSPPDPVTILEVKPQAGGDLFLNWGPVRDALGEVIRYHVWRGSGEGKPSVRVASVPANVLEYLDEGVGLAHGGKYSYRVSAEDGVGNVQADGVVRTGFCDKEAPTPKLTSPTHRPDEWTSTTDAVLEWDLPVDDTGIQEYLWRLDKSPASSLIRGVDESLSAPPLKLPHLTDGLWYAHVSSVDGAGNVSPAAHYPLRVVTRPPHARLKPLPQLANARRVKLEWECEEGVVAVDIGVRAGGAREWLTLATRAEGRGREVEVEGEGIYEFSVRALDTYGRWGGWEEGQVLLVDTTPPLEIPTVTARSIAGGAVVIEWEPSWDELSGLKAYHVLRTRATGGPRETIADIPATEDCIHVDVCEGAEDGARFAYTVWPVDAAGNTLESGPSAEAVSDKSAPAPKVVSRSHPDPAKAYASRKLEIIWDAVDEATGIAGVVVELNASPDTRPNPESLPLRGDKTLAFELPDDGRWFLHVRAVDGAGNAGETVHLSIRVDTHVDAPIVSFAQDPFLEWERSGTVTVILKAPEDPSGVPAFWHLVDAVAETVPDRLNAVRHTGETLKVTPKSEGLWYLHVVAEDGAGNLSVPVHLSMRLSLGLPLPRVIKSTHPEGLWSHLREVSIEWEPIYGDHVEYLYWLARTRQDNPPEGTMRVNEPKCRFAIEEGAWYLHVCAVDARGRKGEAVGFQVRVDATPPLLTVFSPSHAKGRWSAKRRVQYAVEVTDDHSGVGRVEIALTPTGREPDVWELALGTEGEREVPGEGLWTLWARAVDLAGNVSTAGRWDVQVDLDAPPPGLASPTHPEGQWSAAKEAEIWLYPGEDLSGVEEYSVLLIGPGEDIPETPPRDAVLTSDELVRLNVPGDGRWTVVAWARDLAGNTSAPARYLLQADMTAKRPSGFVMEPAGDGGWIRSDAVRVYWKAPEDISGEPLGYLYVLDRDPGTLPEAGQAMFAAVPELDLGGLEDGIHHIHVRTMDLAGNLSPDVVHIKMALDCTPPKLTLACPEIAGKDWLHARNVTIRARGEDTVSGFVGCFWTFHPDGQEAPDISQGRWKEEPEWNVDLPGDGIWVVTVAAMDGAGNLSEPERLLIKIDAGAASPGAIRSPSHPDSAAWYSSREVIVEWDEPVEASGVKDYRYTVDRDPAKMPKPEKWLKVPKPPLRIPLSDDGHWFVAVATEDGAGNLSAPAQLAVLVDSQAATPKLASPSHPRPGVWYVETAVQVVVTAEDSASGLKEILLGVTASDTPDPAELKPVEPGAMTLNLERGSWWIHAIATDLAGNRSSPASISVRVDPALKPPLVVCESHPDPDKWYDNTKVRFKIIPSADATGKKYLAVFDTEPETQPGKTASMVSAGDLEFSASTSGVWYLHVMTAVEGEGSETEAVHLKVQIDLKPPAAPVVRSPTHARSPRRGASHEAVFEWDEPEDVAGIRQYVYTISRASMLGKKEKTGVTAERRVKIPALDQGVWDLNLAATDRAGHTGPPGKYSIAIADTQDLRVLTKSESWRVALSEVEIELYRGESLVRKERSSGVGEAQFKELPYGVYRVAILPGKNNPPQEYEDVHLDEGEQFIQFEVCLAGCAWMISGDKLLLWMPAMWLEGGRIELLPEKGAPVGVHMLKDLPKKSHFLECPLPGNLLAGSFQLKGGSLNKLQWPPIPFKRLP
jgi:predicted RNase H-like HicB family nuclease